MIVIREYQYGYIPNVTGAIGFMNNISDTFKLPFHIFQIDDRVYYELPSNEEFANSTINVMINVISKILEDLDG